MMDSQIQSSGSKQNKFHIVNLDVDVVILNKKVKQVQLAVVPDIWVSDGICYYPNSKNSLPYVMRRSPVGKNWKTYPSTIKSTIDTYTEARIKLAGINSDIETTDSQHDACAAVNEEGRSKRKKRKPTRQLSADESAEIQIVVILIWKSVTMKMFNLLSQLAYVLKKINLPHVIYPHNLLRHLIDRSLLFLLLSMM
ncbi:Uncharacterized protein APZ42_002274 [Daphnia magna]|uniref:Uncharacterized protein n=1 Tax=Daphnia magna TaxID=35525 RepID=A0A164IDT1_9CRUS|nr:Uncharacterized protein APZ42_002274 [Daphnia magna]